MKTLPLGKTGVKVSAFALGTMKFGSALDKSVVYPLLDRYIEVGGSFLDTANMYAFWFNDSNGGESETILGRWIKERKNRSQLFIASKVGYPTNFRDWNNKVRGLQASRIMKECEKSLKRLGIETIDLYYAHYDDRQTPLEETMEAFDRLVKAGKVRFIGASNRRAWRIEEARLICEMHNWTQFCCVQQKYSYLRPRLSEDLGEMPVVNDDLIDYCRVRGITILAHEPLLKGIYARPGEKLVERFNYESADSQARLKALGEVADEQNATPIQIVLTWMHQHDPPIIPIVAPDNLEQFQGDFSALEIKLSEEQISRLNNATG